MTDHAAAIRPVIDSIKRRLQSHQRSLETLSDSDEYVRLATRAELDALWAAIEVVAQRLDGVDPVVVRDYFTETNKAATARSGKVR